MELQLVKLRGPNDLEGALRTLNEARPDALYVVSSRHTVLNIPRIVEFAKAIVFDSVRANFPRPIKFGGVRFWRRTEIENGSGGVSRHEQARHQNRQVRRCSTFSTSGTKSRKISQYQKLVKVVVPRGGIEPPTPAFSVQCSTD
jgi:hypothetical protein